MMEIPGFLSFLSQQIVEETTCRILERRLYQYHTHGSSCVEDFQHALLTVNFNLLKTNEEST